MPDVIPDPPIRPVGQSASTGPLTGPSIRALREAQVGGLTRRTLLRTAIGTGIGLWVVEVLGGSSRSCGPRSEAWAPRFRRDAGRPRERKPGPPDPRTGSRPTSPPRARSSSWSIPHAAAGRPASIRPATARPSTSGRSRSAARTSAVGPTHASRTTGSAAHATSRATTGSGSRPPVSCIGPAPRGMDRFAIEVDARGVLIDRDRQGHARAAAGRPRASRHDPAADRARLRMTGPAAALSRGGGGDATATRSGAARRRSRGAGATGWTSCAARSTRGCIRRCRRASPASRPWSGAAVDRRRARGDPRQPVPPDWPGYLLESLGPRARSAAVS